MRLDISGTSMESIGTSGSEMLLAVVELLTTRRIGVLLFKLVRFLFCT